MIIKQDFRKRGAHLQYEQMSDELCKLYYIYRNKITIVNGLILFKYNVPPWLHQYQIECIHNNMTVIKNENV